MFKALAYDACGLVIVLILFYAPAMVPEELARANASQVQGGGREIHNYYGNCNLLSMFLIF